MKQEQYVCLVCGYNYVIGYEDRKRRFTAGPLFDGY